ncbi:MAG: hypothetical protein KJ061_05525 [Vicinamibacteraceae bacterium]|nr:hypothetical protein [Vicinamibacteraceae bacterium]
MPSTSPRADLASGLLASQPGPCVSLYQPTHRHFPDSKQDPIRFRNLLKAVEDSLARGHDKTVTGPILGPLRALADDETFWLHRRDGLAVLAAPRFQRVYTLLRPVPERAIVASSFHIKPLVRIAQSADGYQVLALTRQTARLFEGNRDALQEIDMAPGARTITEALGEELTEPHLTVASYGGASGPAMHHGHGTKSAEVDVDAERYFRAVDRVVLEHHSRPSGLPLVLAALGEHQTPFRRVSQNPALVEEGVVGDPEALDVDELGRRTWQAIEPRYLARLADLIERFETARVHGLGAADLTEAGVAARAGRVGVLLVEADRVVPGRLAPGTGRVELASLDHPEVDDVLDDIAEMVMAARGEVVVVPGDKMPDRTGLAAIYRF